MVIEIAGVKMYSVADLAKELKVTEVTVRSYIRRGLKAKKILGKWHVAEDNLREFLLKGDLVRDLKKRG